MTETQKYLVIDNYGEFETRLYKSVVLADVVVQADRNSAGNQAFGPLFNYITTNKIAMTAPVLQEKEAKLRDLMSAHGLVAAAKSEVIASLSL
jgi:hypothetical protein